MKRGREEGEEEGGGGNREKRRKKTAGFSRGSQSVECLMKFLEEVPRPLQRKTQNHSLGERDSRIKRQKVNHKKRQRLRKKGAGDGWPPSRCKKTSWRDLFSSVLNQNTLMRAERCRGSPS